MAAFKHLFCFFAQAAGALSYLLAWGSFANAAPNVLVTIKPVHSLAAAILEGVTEPKLLLKGAASPHSYALKPSDARAVSEADALVFVSKNLETFLQKPIAALSAKARVIDLEKTPELRLLPMREAGLMEASEDAGAHDGHEHGAYDVHFWLDPLNAIAIARHLAREFTALDPEHAAQYQANARKLEAALASLDRELGAALSGLSNRPFIVFHDVLQYLETRYGLHAAGSIALSPEREPGARRLAAVRAKIEETNAICVFSEPEFPPKLVQVLTTGTHAKRGVLDEAGAAIPAGPALYFELMRMDAASLSACLR